ncbi:sugar transporter SWEET1-like [Babylonia areolata]|uniref:sugar transporter SWEET1-like n=1 Tax=Babylonia areolata TaxID=304850 RepID=UPI003FD137B1
MELLYFVELVTTGVTFLNMASGIPVCLTMYRTGSTHNVPYVLFLVSAINSTLALYYGVLVSNTTFILINIVGFLLWGVYIFVYISVSKSKRKPLYQLLASVVMVAAHAVYLRLVTPTPPVLTNTLGVFVFVWAVLLLLTPVLDIIEIVKQGTSAGSDVFLMLGGTVCCVAWLVYGYLLDDVFVYGPNILGLAVNGVKLTTMAAYNSSFSGSKVKSQ